jgi:hypothetical protein
MERLRALDLPRRVTVRTDGAGLPLAVRGRRGFVAVEGVRDRWRIDDEWWRTPLSRDYFEVILAGGRPLLLFRDRIGGDWYFQ